MSQKIEFVERATEEGANVAKLCIEYGVSRETGHKWLRRFRQKGYVGLDEESRRPKLSKAATSEELVLAVIEARDAHPFWGPVTLRDLLKRKYGEKTPSRATIARILAASGQVRRRRRKTVVSIVTQAPSVEVNKPNDLWTVDFKGRWNAGDASRCEPLTVRDACSRYVLTSQIFAETKTAVIRRHFEKLFREYGVPGTIQVDNGTPFISVISRGGLTRLSAWWISLGITVVRSRLASPQDNGGHERMHREIAEQVEAFRGPTRVSEQRALNKWRLEFNQVRPHAALGGKAPAEVYTKSARKNFTTKRYAYPRNWLQRSVSGPGLFSMNGRNYPVGKAFIGYNIALEPLDGLRYRLWFHEVDLGTVEIAPSTLDVEQILSFKLKTTSQRRKPETKIRRGSNRPARRGAKGPRAGQRQ